MATLRFLRLSLQELSRCALWLSAWDHQGSKDPASPSMVLPPLSPSPPPPPPPSSRSGTTRLRQSRRTSPERLDLNIRYPLAPGVVGGEAVSGYRGSVPSTRRRLRGPQPHMKLCSGAPCRPRTACRRRGTAGLQHEGARTGPGREHARAEPQSARDQRATWTAVGRDCSTPAALEP